MRVPNILSNIVRDSPRYNYFYLNNNLFKESHTYL